MNNDIDEQTKNFVDDLSKKLSTFRENSYNALIAHYTDVDTMKAIATQFEKSLVYAVELMFSDEFDMVSDRSSFQCEFLDSTGHIKITIVADKGSEEFVANELDSQLVYIV